MISKVIVGDSNEIFSSDKIILLRRVLIRYVKVYQFIQDNNNLVDLCYQVINLLGIIKRR